MSDTKMTLQAAVAYLQPIADSAIVGGYAEALGTVMLAAQVVPQPNRESLADEEAVFEYFGLNNLYVLPVLAADGEPYLIGMNEDGDVFAQGLPYEEDGVDTGQPNVEWLKDKPEGWWPILPLLPVAAPASIEQEGADRGHDIH